MINQTKKLIYQFTSCSLLGVVLLFSVPRASAEEISAAFSVFPPLNFPNALKRPDGPGVLVEFYQNVLPMLGYQVNLLQLPPKRIVTLMAKGQGVDLYSCADHTIGKRPHYAYGPPMIYLNVQLFQNAKLPQLSGYKDLKNQTVIKQHGFSGLEKLLHSSNNFITGHSSSVAAMFVRGRADYLLDFKERIETMINQESQAPEIRTYPIRSFVAHLCLNRRFADAETRIQKIHDAMIQFQDTPDGQQILRKYGYTGRFGNQAKSVNRK